MASRRIQPSTPGRDATQVTASPVSTFVSPGAAGMPAAPVGRIEPTPPDTQEARDLENLAKAFGSLSGALSDLGKANALLDRPDRAKQESMADARRLGREAAEGVDINPLLSGQQTLTQISLEMNKLLEEGAITATQLPHFNKAFALGLGERIGRETGSKAKIEFARILETDPNAARNPKLVEKFLSGLNELNLSDIPDWIGDQNAYAAAYLNQAAKDRAWFEATHSEWLVKDQKKTETNNLTYSTNEILSEVLGTLQEEAQRDVVLFAPGTLQFERAKNTSADIDFTEVAADQITQLLDGKFGGASIMSPDDRNTIVGQALVDYAVNTPNIDLKKQALAVFKKVKTGPSGGRGLLSKKGPVNDYFLENEARILNAITAAEERQKKEAQLAEQEALEAAIEKSTEAWDSEIKTSNENMQQSLIADIKLRGGSYNSIAGFVDAVRDTLRTGNPDDALVKFLGAGNGRIEGSSIKFTNPISGKETTVDIESFVRKAVETARNDIYRAELRILQGKTEDASDPTYRTFNEAGESVPLDDYTLQLLAQVRATKKLGIYENRVVRDQLRDAVILQASSEHGVNPSTLQAGLLAFREMTVMQRGNHMLAKQVLGDMYEIYRVMDDMTNISEYGGGGFSGVQKIADTLSRGALSQEAINRSAKLYEPVFPFILAEDSVNQALSTFDNPVAARAKLLRLTGLYMHLSGATPDKEMAAEAARRVLLGMQKSTVAVQSQEESGPKYIDVSQIDPSYVMGNNSEMTNSMGKPERIDRYLSEVQATLVYGSDSFSSPGRPLPATGPLTQEQTAKKKGLELYRSIAANSPDVALWKKHPPYFVPVQGSPGEPIRFRLYVPYQSILETNGVGYQLLQRNIGSVDFYLSELQNLRMSPAPKGVPEERRTAPSPYGPSYPTGRR